MATITERGGRYFVRVRRYGHSAAKTFTRKQDASAWARRTEADIEAGRWRPSATTATPTAEESAKGPDVPTLASAIAEYERTVAVHFKGAVDYSYRFKELAATEFAVQPLDQVTARDISAWRDAQLASHKPATVVRKLALLSGVFNWAIRERGWVSANPTANVRRPRVSDGRTRLLSPLEWRCLLTAARSSKAKWLPDALVVFARTAMRRAELAGLKLADISFEARTAHLSETKNGSARDVPLCPEAIEALKRLALDARDAGRSTLLPIGAAGSISTRFAATVRRAQAMHRASQAAHETDIPTLLADVRLHDLRHQAISHWAATGLLSLPELMAVSGHKTPRMLARYAHIQAPELARKLARLSPPSA